MLSTNDYGLLVGTTVAWQTNGGKVLQGKVTSYRPKGDRLNLQVLRPDGSHLWFLAEILEDSSCETFCVIKHGPTSIEYGLGLADMILAGKGTTRPINTQLTTLAATCVALQEQIEQLTASNQEREAIG